MNIASERTTRNALTLVSTAAEKPAPRDFSWGDADSMILLEQPATAVYWDRLGNLVIRQKSAFDDDGSILISPSNIETFVDELTDFIGIPSVGR